MKSPSSLGSLAGLCRHFAVWCLSLVIIAAGTVRAAGVAALKEQSFHPDDLAKPVVYLSMKQQEQGVWKIVTGGSTITVEQAKVAGFIDIPSQLPDEITTDKEAEPLRDFVAELKDFAKRYPKCEPLLREHVTGFSEHLAKYDKGMVRHGGKWITKADFAATRKKQQDATAASAQQQQERRAELEKQAGKERAAAAKREKENEEFAAKQRAKGLAYWDGKWRPAAEADVLKEGERLLETARGEVKANAIFNAKYVVLAKGVSGVLIRIVEGKSSRLDERGSEVALYGTDLNSMKKGQVYETALFWASTDSYREDGEMRSIETYEITQSAAVERRIALMWQKDAPWNRADKAAKRQPGKSKEEGANPDGIPDILADSDGSGSAFFVGTEGYLVTNAHVVEGAKSLEIHYQDRLVPAAVVKVNKTADLALLKIDAKVEGLPIAEVEAQPGSDVFAIGYPQPVLQGLSTKVTKGIINSSKGAGENDTVFQVDAAIQPGNSGGPLCDSAGHVVGVTVAILDPLKTAELTGNLPQNVNYAIKASEVMSLLRSKGITFTTAKPAAEGTAGTTDATQKAMKATVLVIRR